MVRGASFCVNPAFIAGYDTEGGEKMNFFLAAGNIVLSVACSIVGNILDRYIQRRKDSGKRQKSEKNSPQPND